MSLLKAFPDEANTASVWKRRMAISLGIDYFVHPLPLLAVSVLILNDHFLKFRFPSALTGKLSDFAGLFFFPLLLCAIWNLLRNVLRRLRESNPSSFSDLTFRQLVIAILITDLIFVSVKLNPAIARIYISLLDQIGFPSRVTHDPTDLMALITNAATYVFGRSRLR